MPLPTTFNGNSKSRSRARGGRLSASSPLSAARSLDVLSAPIAFGRNEGIFCEGQPAECIYKMETGCARTYKTLDSGQRQLIAFHLPGDCFALEGREHHAVSAEATTDSQIRVIKRKALLARNGDAAMVRYLLDLTAEELRRTQRHNQLLLRGAHERVVGFLLEMLERGRSESEIALHMTRRDIADYLGLTVETVSRTLSRLEADSTISLPTPWRVVLKDLAALSVQ